MSSKNKSEENGEELLNVLRTICETFNLKASILISVDEEGSILINDIDMEEDIINYENFLMLLSKAGYVNELRMLNGENYEGDLNN